MYTFRNFLDSNENVFVFTQLFSHGRKREKREFFSGALLVRIQSSFSETGYLSKDKDLLTHDSEYHDTDRQVNHSYYIYRVIEK